MVLTYQQITVNQTNLQNVVCEKLGISYIWQKGHEMKLMRWHLEFYLYYSVCIMSPTTNLSQDQVLLHPAGVLIQSLALGLTTSGLHPYSCLHSHVGLPIKEV